MLVSSNHCRLPVPRHLLRRLMKTLQCAALLFVAVIFCCGLAKADTSCVTDDGYYTATPCTAPIGGMIKMVIKRNSVVKPQDANYDATYSMVCATVEPKGSNVSIRDTDATQ